MPGPPIQYFIVLMLENRSFDHMLGYLRAPDYQIDGLKGDGKRGHIRSTPQAKGECRLSQARSF
jgi:phospholipase C